MFDVIKIRLKRRYATRRRKGNQPLNIKTERPFLKLGLPNFRWSFNSILLLVVTLLFRRIFLTSNMTLSCASIFRKVMNTIFNLNFKLKPKDYFD